jgi:hypothetical protein
VRWIASRRSNELDQPKPETISHEWIVHTDPWRMRLGAAWPDTDEGRRDAEEVAEALNESFVAGMREAQKAARLAMGLSR